MEIDTREIRKELGVTQAGLSSLLGMSIRAVQSYEQRWRKPSEPVQRMLVLLLLAHRNGKNLSKVKCWRQKSCPSEVRENCISFKSDQGHLCWFFTGTLCSGKQMKDWPSKWRACQKCDVLRGLLARA